MKDTYKNKYRVDTARLKNYDYNGNGLYFVTIGTGENRNYFGTLQKAQLVATPIGKVAGDFWQAIPEHFPFVGVDEFVIMPNHLHSILLFDNPEFFDREYVNLTVSEQVEALDGTLEIRNGGNSFGPQTKNLASVIRNYKAAVTSYANKNSIRFKWHPRYHDRIIRSPEELQAVRNYIRQNPSKG
jgi:putative transposase